MRKLALCVVLGLAALGLYANENVEAFKRLYLAAPSIVQKYEIMSVLVELSDASSASVLGEALAELNRMDASKFSVTERDAYFKILRLLCAAVGLYRNAESQDDLLKIALSEYEPNLRAEALIALGRLRALKHVEQIVKLLNSTNMASTADPIFGETLAYGCVMALVKMRDIRGWPSVFEASNSWYTGRIKQAAVAALPAMVDDPTPAARSVIESDTMQKRMLALKFVVESKAPAESKINVCRLALKKGIETRSPLNADKSAATTLRRIATESLISLADGKAETVELYKSAYLTADLDERLLLLAAYGANKSDAAALALNEIIFDFNLTRLSDLTSSDVDRLIKAAIQNAGATKNDKVLPSLMAVNANQKWSGSVLKAADDARKQIQAR